VTNSFNSYDLGFHVYWDRTRQAMTCGSTQASYCWPWILSIPPWKNASAPPIPVMRQPQGEEWPVALEIGAYLPRDVIERELLPMLNPTDVMNLQTIFGKLSRLFRWDTAIHQQAMHCLEYVRPLVSRPHQLTVSGCCSCPYDPCTFCKSHVNNKSEHATYARHVWIMVPTLVVDAWLHNPQLVTPSRDPYRSDHKNPSDIDMRIGVETATIRCIYRGIASLTIFPDQPPQTHSAYMPKYLHTHIVRFHIWGICEDESLRLPSLRQNTYGWNWNYQRAWTLQMTFEGQDNRTSSPSFHWDFNTHRLKPVRCPWNENKDDMHRAIHNVSYPHEGTSIYMPLTFAEHPASIVL
jgi:hypothetical protein